MTRERYFELLNNMPEKRYAGTGALGIFPEDLLDLTTGDKDIPDSLAWKLKYYSSGTDLITLFHKEPQPKRPMWQNDLPSGAKS